MGLVEFASVRLVFGSRSEKRRNGERSNGHSQEQDERHHQGSPLVFAALPGEYRGCLTRGRMKGLEPSVNLCGDFLEFLARVNKKGPAGAAQNACNSRRV
jgi:hypothetical protein